MLQYFIIISEFGYNQKIKSLPTKLYRVVVDKEAKMTFLNLGSVTRLLF